MGFNVISKPTLKDFWEEYADSKEALETWYKLLTKSEATNFSELKETFGSADYVQPDYIIFDIKGNTYRVMTRVNFTYKTFWIKHVFTHAEYDKWKPEKE
jgi:mRNA interferase HigB